MTHTSRSGRDVEPGGANGVRLAWLEHTRRDLQHAARGMRRYPLAALVALVSLGAGIGSTTAALVARDAIFRKPPPLYTHPEQLARITVHTPDRGAGLAPAQLYRVWSEAADPDLVLAAAATERAVELRAGERLATVPMQRVTPGLFELLGVAPAIGRTLDRGGDVSGPCTIVVAHRVWRDVFHRQADVLGRTATIDREPCVIVGVMPARFWFGSMNTGVWRALDVRTFADADRVDVVTRGSAGLTPEAVAARLERAAITAPQLSREQRDLRIAAAAIAGIPLARQVAPYVVWLLGAAVFFTLLIACTNVAVLMMAQWTLREHEIAVRASLGATRARLVRALVSESLLLACAGGLLGVAATFAVRGLLVRAAGDAPMLDLSIDPRILFQTTMVALTAGIITGLGPALYETRRLHAAPGQSARSHERVRQRFRYALVVFEIAVTGALLVVTGALVSAYQRTLSYDPGFDRRHLVVASVRHAEAVPVDALLERARQAPGVTRAAISNAAPLVSSGPQTEVSADAAGSRTTRAERAIVTADFLATMGTDVVRGRDLSERDSSSAARVALVNEVVATRLWPAGDAVGSQLWIDGAPREIVGVVRSRPPTALSRPGATIYVPMAQEEKLPTRLDLVVRTSGAAGGFVGPVRQTLGTVHGAEVLSVVALSAIQEMAALEVLGTALPMVPLISTAVLLAATGIYGVLAFAMTRRAREIAVRVSLGASRRHVVWLAASQGARLVVAGALCGLGATWLLTRLAQGAGGVFDGPGWQAFAMPALLLFAIGVAATWLPSRRALRIDPAALLRDS